MIKAPEPDTYGPYARASLLADYVELLTLNGHSVKRAMLADFLADNDWNLELIQLSGSESIHGDSSVLAEHLDEADDVASIVFRQLDERRDILTERYPFEITDDAIALDCRVDLETSPYVAVLALTIAHAFRLDSIHRPDEMFERMVLKVLKARGLSSAGIAVRRREGSSFEEALQNACDEVGLKANPSAAARHVWAHDEGVDVLCHFGWEENLRPGTWGYIGQVTVGRSDSWERKINEPSPEQWKLFTGTCVPPSPFLAVPHHVERPTMAILTLKGVAIVLDRLRLVRFKEGIDAGERDLIRAVIGEDVEPLAG